MDDFYIASKTRSGRPGWSVIFRHPLRRDARGKAGLKIRRGLATTDDEHAEVMIGQLNLLLADRRWWSADRRLEAEHLFAAPIVSAFFDGMETGHIDTAQLRESRIALPGRDQGYARVLLVGTTGAGKTTLLRHLIGSSHDQDRFPSTSTAKTTVADMEVVTAEGAFTAAITFMSEFEVRAHIDECIEAACLEVIEGQSDARVAAALLTHREQRFRLGYVLGEGDPDIDAADADDDDFTFDAAPAATSPIPDDETVSSAERRANAEHLARLLARVKALALASAASHEADHGALAACVSLEERAAWFEGFGDGVFASEDFAKLSLDIRDEIENRFDRLDPACLTRSATGWPELWTFTSPDHAAFLRQVRWFSSNHFRQFGRLLTPLVDGIRVRGPFYPLLPGLRVADKLVLFDGQGMGHTATDSLTSISTAVTRRFADTDMILLVDGAQQPMQAAPLSLMRAVASAGHADKLALVFSHFDQVRGDNLETTAQKRAHVMASVSNALAGLRQYLGVPVATSLERRLTDRVFMVGALDREISALPPGVVRELRVLLAAMQAAGGPGIVTESSPIYAIGGLELALRDAVDSFQRPWEARLGLAYRDGIREEHWTRVKALTRRFANAWGDEYDTMRPASDLIGRLQEEISRWLDSPAAWTRPPGDEDERMAALNPIRNAVFTALHVLVTDRLADQHRAEWMQAYAQAGRESATRRAGAIRAIYEDSAPTISSAMKPKARVFLRDVMALIAAAVTASGGSLEMVRPP